MARTEVWLNSLSVLVLLGCVPALDHIPCMVDAHCPEDRPYCTSGFCATTGQAAMVAASDGGDSGVAGDAGGPADADGGSCAFTGCDGGTGGVDGGLVFSIGVTDNAAVGHMVAPLLRLVFEAGTPSADVVVSRRFLVPPTLDGDDGEWTSVAGSLVPLQPAGAAIGMNIYDWNTGYGLLSDGGTRPFAFGVEQVLLKSAFDDSNIYFLVKWLDGTASTAKNTLTFEGGGWSRDLDDEDRVYLAFDVSFPSFTQFGCAASCHLRERLDDRTDAGMLWRTRMHTSSAGEVVDVWSWGSVATNPIGYADDLSFTQTYRINDDTRGFSASNRKNVSDGGVEPIYMSEYGVNSNPAALYAPDSGLHPAAVPFDPSGLVPGSHVSGLVHQVAGGSRADVRAVGRWRGGVWTVEFARARVTPDPNDARF